MQVEVYPDDKHLLDPGSSCSPRQVPPEPCKNVLPVCTWRWACCGVSDGFAFSHMRGIRILSRIPGGEMTAKRAGSISVHLFRTHRASMQTALELWFPSCARLRHQQWTLLLGVVLLLIQHMILNFCCIGLVTHHGALIRRTSHPYLCWCGKAKLFGHLSDRELQGIPPDEYKVKADTQRFSCSI